MRGDHLMIGIRARESTIHPCAGTTPETVCGSTSSHGSSPHAWGAALHEAPGALYGRFIRARAVIRKTSLDDFMTRGSSPQGRGQNRQSANPWRRIRHSRCQRAGRSFNAGAPLYARRMSISPFPNALAEPKPTASFARKAFGSVISTSPLRSSTAIPAERSWPRAMEICR